MDRHEYLMLFGEILVDMGRCGTMNQNEIILQLFHERQEFLSETLATDTQYKEKESESFVHSKRLREVLSEEQYEVFETYMKTSDELYEFVEKNCFYQGFCLGAKLMLEILGGDNSVMEKLKK